MILGSRMIEAKGKKTQSVAVDDGNGVTIVVNIVKGEKVAVPISAANDLSNKGLIAAVEVPVEPVAVEVTDAPEENISGN